MIHISSQPFSALFLAWSTFCSAHDNPQDEQDRVLRGNEPMMPSSFDLLCTRLESMPSFLCECVSEIPDRSIECQSTEMCSSCNVCGQFLFQVDYLGPDISRLQSCVSYTNIPADHSNYMDGCFTIVYEGQETPLDCILSFVKTPEAPLQECESCSLCDATAETAQTRCDNVQSVATAGCTSTQIDAFFPGFRAGDCDVPSSQSPTLSEALVAAALVTSTVACYCL